MKSELRPPKPADHPAKYLSTADLTRGINVSAVNP